MERTVGESAGAKEGKQSGTKFLRPKPAADLRGLAAQPEENSAVGDTKMLCELSDVAMKVDSLPDGVFDLGVKSIACPSYPDKTILVVRILNYPRKEPGTPRTLLFYTFAKSFSRLFKSAYHKDYDRACQKTNPLQYHESLRFSQYRQARRLQAPMTPAVK
jgi:hypothetical protein